MLTRSSKRIFNQMRYTGLKLFQTDMIAKLHYNSRWILPTPSNIDWQIMPKWDFPSINDWFWLFYSHCIPAVFEASTELPCKQRNRLLNQIWSAITIKIWGDFIRFSDRCDCVYIETNNCFVRYKVFRLPRNIKDE